MSTSISLGRPAYIRTTPTSPPRSAFSRRIHHRVDPIVIQRFGPSLKTFRPQNPTVRDLEHVNYTLDTIHYAQSR